LRVRQTRQVKKNLQGEKQDLQSQTFEKKKLFKERGADGPFICSKRKKGNKRTWARGVTGKVVGNHHSDMGTRESVLTKTTIQLTKVKQNARTDLRGGKCAPE